MRSNRTFRYFWRPRRDGSSRFGPEFSRLPSTGPCADFPATLSAPPWKDKLVEFDKIGKQEAFIGKTTLFARPTEPLFGFAVPTTVPATWRKDVAKVEG